MARVHQGVLIVSTILLSWLMMQGVHELGHVLGAWCTGGSVTRVVLHPLTISRTDVAINPRPLTVAWGGCIVGVLLPLALWGGALALRCSWQYLLRFFAGFCSIANGAYVAAGSWERQGDAADMLRSGANAGQLWLFGIVTVPLGFLLWHRLGPHFGLGPGARAVNPKVAYGSLLTLILVVVVEFLFSAK